jgi:hypothetical protein
MVLSSATSQRQTNGDDLPAESSASLKPSKAGHEVVPATRRTTALTDGRGHRLADLMPASVGAHRPRKPASLESRKVTRPPRPRSNWPIKILSRALSQPPLPVGDGCQKSALPAGARRRPVDRVLKQPHAERFGEGFVLRPGLEDAIDAMIGSLSSKRGTRPTDRSCLKRPDQGADGHEE